MPIRNLLALMMVGLMMVPGALAEEASGEVPAEEPGAGQEAQQFDAEASMANEGPNGDPNAPAPLKILSWNAQPGGCPTSAPACIICPGDAPQGDGSLPVAVSTVDPRSPGVGVATGYSKSDGFYNFEGGRVDKDGCQ